ncbi:MAG: hypothetical protein ABIY55_07800 [Kofleriaceae bacterium]
MSSSVEATTIVQRWKVGENRFRVNSGGMANAASGRTGLLRIVVHADDSRPGDSSERGAVAVFVVTGVGEASGSSSPLVTFAPSVTLATPRIARAG